MAIMPDKEPPGVVLTVCNRCRQFGRCVLSDEGEAVCWCCTVARRELPKRDPVAGGDHV